MCTLLFQNWRTTEIAALDFKRHTFVACAILLLVPERNALIPLEVNLKGETSTLLWCWPCSGKLPCFPLPTLQYQSEMFTSGIRLNVSFLRSLTLVIPMYIWKKKREQSAWLTKQTNELYQMYQFVCVNVTLTLTLVSEQHSNEKQLVLKSGEFFHTSLWKLTFYMVCVFKVPCFTLNLFKMLDVHSGLNKSLQKMKTWKLIYIGCGKPEK